MVDQPPKPSVYVDANPFIYFVEGDEVVAKSLKPFFELMRLRPGAAATSELTLAEVLPKARPQARRSYLDLIVWSKVFSLQPVTREILIDTADYRQTVTRSRAGRQDIMPKLPDAIHIVTAVRSRCQMFLSADRSLRLPSGMKAFQPNASSITKLLQEIA